MTCTNQARLSRFARKKIGQLQVADDPGVDLHVQQTTLAVYLPRLGGFFEDLATGLLPLHLDRNNERKTPAPPLFRFCGCLVRSPFGHGGASVKSLESSYLT